MITQPCGCVNDIDRTCGAQFSVLKCHKHRCQQRDPATLGEAYYAELGTVAGGVATQTAHVMEFEDGFGPLSSPLEGRSKLAVEIGCGASPYVPMFRNAGWTYHGVDSSEWACAWMQEKYGVGMTRVNLGDDTGITLPGVSAGIVFCAHSMEHFKKPHAVLAMIRDMLEPGGLAYILVPDDSDPVNPDHEFFFNRITLHRALTRAGFEVESMEMRRIVAHENFIYAKARKPE